MDGEQQGNSEYIKVEFETITVIFWMSVYFVMVPSPRSFPSVVNNTLNNNWVLLMIVILKVS